VVHSKSAKPPVDGTTADLAKENVICRGTMRPATCHSTYYLIVLLGSAACAGTSSRTSTVSTASLLLCNDVVEDILAQDISHVLAWSANDQPYPKEFKPHWKRLVVVGPVDPGCLLFLPTTLYSVLLKKDG
jgi:hypothetical protein